MSVAQPGSSAETEEVKTAVTEDPKTNVTEDEKTIAAESEETSVEEAAAAKKAVDPVQALLDEDDRSVPEGVFLKQKKENKKLKKDLEELRQSVVVQQKQDLKAPNVEDYDDGAADPKYVDDLSGYLEKKIESKFSDTASAASLEQKKAEYQGLYDKRINTAYPEAEKRIIKYKGENPDCKQRLESPEMVESFKAMPSEIIAVMIESEDVGLLMDYYSRSPVRLDNLVNLDVNELINLGRKLGALKSNPRRTAKLDQPESPVSGKGGTTTKLHPVNDGRDAYIKACNNNVEKGTAAWKKALDDMRKNKGD